MESLGFSRYMSRGIGSVELVIWSAFHQAVRLGTMVMVWTVISLDDLADRGEV